MAGSNRGSDHGGGGSRAADACADWRHAGTQPEPSAGATAKAQGPQEVQGDAMKDAFDLWWEWAKKPLDTMLTIPAELHDAVMALSPEDRRDRAKVNEVARQAEQNREH
jgi:hypothetical protein